MRSFPPAHYVFSPLSSMVLEHSSYDAGYEKEFECTAGALYCHTHYGGVASFSALNFTSDYSLLAMMASAELGEQVDLCLQFHADFWEFISMKRNAPLDLQQFLYELQPLIVISSRGEVNPRLCTIANKEPVIAKVVTKY